MIRNCNNNISYLNNIFSKVFISNDPFDKMFSSSIESKIILYPTNGYYLSKEQYVALIRTNEIFDEKLFYLSEIEGEPFKINDPCEIHPQQHFELDTSTPYNEYEKVTIILENALYSHTGRWGVIISHEDHAVIGGCKEYISTFKKLYPNWEKDQKELIKNLEYWGKLAHKDTSWILDFIKNINT